MRSGATLPAILSFGCSTGEECFSIREYFPYARIFGTDIDRLNISIAKRRNKDQNIIFFHNKEVDVRLFGPYDIIFCLSVLCRWNETAFVTDCSAIYPFNKFEGVLRMLSDNLRDGGLLVLYNSNFRFEDSSLILNYVTIDTPTIADSGFVHKFDKNNRKIHDKHQSIVFQKRPASSTASMHN
jgi:hypothetical protein